MNAFDKTVRQHLGKNLHSDEVGTIQVNLGLRCNLSCRHCHVEGAPDRPEVMSWTTMTSVLRLGEHLPGALFDLTGGAPELNPDFRRFVEGGGPRGRTPGAGTHQSHRAVRARTGEPGRLLPTAGGSAGGLLALLPRRQRRRPARSRGLRKEHRSPAPSQRPRLRTRPAVFPQPGLQPRRRFSAPGADRAGVRLPPVPAGALRHRLHPPADHHQHADRPLHG